MSATFVLLQLAGFVALLLWGMRMVHTGMVRAFGGNLRQFLAIGLKSRWKAFLAGMGITALLQSSTATALMSTSFIAAGFMTIVPALAVTLGANVGSTLIVQVLSFNVSAVAPLFMLAGVVAFNRGGKSRTRDLGRVSIGAGLILLALHLIVATIEPVEKTAALRELFALVSGDSDYRYRARRAADLGSLFEHCRRAPGHDVGRGIRSLRRWQRSRSCWARTSAMSSRSILLRAETRLPGSLRLEISSCGARDAWSLSRFYPGSRCHGRAGRKPGAPGGQFSYALQRRFGGCVHRASGSAGPRLCEVHSARADAHDPGAPQYLKPAVIQSPNLALADATREVLRMVDIVQSMLTIFLDALRNDDRKQLAALADMDDDLDRLHNAVKRHLTEISRQEGLSEADAKRCSDILAFTINLEHIGDILDKNLRELAAKKIKRKLKFSDDGLEEITSMHRCLLDNLHLATSVFVIGDIHSARALLAEKDRMRDLEQAANENHLRRLREGKTESIETSSLHIDITRDLKRITAHMASVAYPILERTVRYGARVFWKTSRWLWIRRGAPIEAPLNLLKAR
jgi:phosphate:Na+ symporter